MSTFAIDASSANKERRSGVEWYAYHLIQAMKTRALAEGERVVLFSPEPLRGSLAELPAGWESRVLRWPFGGGWMRARVGWEMLWKRPDVLLVPAQGLPAFGTCATVVHDVGYARVPGAYRPSDRRRIARSTRRAVRRAKKIFAVSEFTRRETSDLLRVPAETIAVAPNASNPNVYRKIGPSELDSALRGLRVGRHFFLYVGRLDEKKNLKTLIRAFELFKADRGMGDPFELLLVGSPGYRFSEIKAYVDHSPVKAAIRLLGYLPEAQVAALMNVATAFVFPSWYEGFGVPPLEAMACGAPVIASDIGAHREVCADAAIYAPPGEPESWTQAMRRVVAEPETVAALRAKGTERVAAYSWQKTADIVWEGMRGVL